jgi:hypothetical protein
MQAAANLASGPRSWAAAQYDATPAAAARNAC